MKNKKVCKINCDNELEEVELHFIGNRKFAQIENPGYYKIANKNKNKINSRKEKNRIPKIISQKVHAREQQKKLEIEEVLEFERQEQLLFAQELMM